MPSLSNIVSVSIQRQTLAVAQTEFNRVMFLAPHVQFVPRTKLYSTLDAVLADFDEESSIGKAAAMAFSDAGYGTVSSFIVGKKHVNTVTVSVGTVANSTAYKVTISGQEYSYTSGVGATAISICAGIEAAYALSPITGITVTDNEDGTISIASSMAWSVTTSANLTVTEGTSTESWVDAARACRQHNDTWYCLTAATRDDADIEALAEYINGTVKIYGTGSPDVVDLTEATTGIAARLKELGYNRTFVLYSGEADSEYPEVQWAASQLLFKPGTNTWADKDIVGVAPDNIDDSQLAYAEEHNLNLLTSFGGVRSTYGGYMAGGEFIDVMVLVDYINARISERVWRLLRVKPKLGHSSRGYVQIESAVRSVLTECVIDGGLAQYPAFKINVPAEADIPINDKAARRFTGLTFTATLEGAIHFVTINGTVSV